MPESWSETGKTIVLGCLGLSSYELHRVLAEISGELETRKYSLCDVPRSAILGSLVLYKIRGTAWGTFLSHHMDSASQHQIHTSLFPTVLNGPRCIPRWLAANCRCPIGSNNCKSFVRCDPARWIAFASLGEWHTKVVISVVVSRRPPPNYLILLLYGWTWLAFLSRTLPLTACYAFLDAVSTHTYKIGLTRRGKRYNSTCGPIFQCRTFMVSVDGGTHDQMPWAKRREHQNLYKFLVFLPSFLILHWTVLCLIQDAISIPLPISVSLCCICGGLLW